MATQYTDDTFSSTLPLDEALGVFNDALEAGTAKAFHVGNQIEIEKAKKIVDLQKQIDELGNKIADMKAKTSGVLSIPTDEQIKKILG